MSNRELVITDRLPFLSKTVFNDSSRAMMALVEDQSHE